MFSLAGKTALVTGASRGIGRGIALSLAKVGATVAINYRENQPEAMATADEVEKLGVKAIIVKADVSKKDDCIGMFAVIKQQFGSLNILVNNAGVVAMGPVENVGEEEWDRVLNTNLKGQFLCIQEAIKIMPAGGKIVCISSIASGGVGVGFGNIAHYAASKGGVVAMVEDLAIELGPKGININAIGPGIIESDMTAGMLSDEKIKAGFLQRIPKGRIGRPEDIGTAVVFLASDEADYITGVTLYVDGGWLTK